MTGEIDTQGRITGIGGLGVKLETAYSAGCKTMIIPRENLHGEGGISQLPEGFRQELQILTYEEWKNRHEPFDYTRQVMQVVAVDHILQAADVAFIDEEEIDALESSFTEHARIAAKELSDAVANSFRRLRVIYIEDPDELDTEFYESDFCRKDHGCTLLVNPEVKERVLSKVEGLAGLISVREFDPHQETFTEILQDLVEQHIDSSLPPLRTSVIAPLTFLQSEGVRMEDFPAGTTFLGLRLFASTCTVENVQICDSRKIINRAYLRLAHFTAQMIEKSPFMVRKDGIYMVSLSFIPEKYRLDSKRGEEILNRCLSEWLNVIDEKQRYTDGDKLPELSIVRK
jgi:ATP-dependent Lon protease